MALLVKLFRVGGKRHASPTPDPLPSDMHRVEISTGLSLSMSLIMIILAVLKMVIFPIFGTAPFHGKSISAKSPR